MQTFLNEAKMVTKELAYTYKAEKIILFGSTARGDYREDSDIDLLIIKHSTKKRAYRIKEVFEALRNVDRKYPLDPIVYTPAEVEKRIHLGDYFMKRILAEGKVLYG